MDMKERLSPRLLAIDGVAGVGEPEGQLTIYLEEDSDLTKKQVANVLQSEAVDLPFRYVVTGEFEAG